MTDAWLQHYCKQTLCCFLSYPIYKVQFSVVSAMRCVTYSDCITIQPLQDKLVFE